MRTVALPSFVVAFLLSGFAAAQDVPVPPTPPPPPPAPKPVQELADHESVVHHLAVGYMGTSQIPIANGTVMAGMPNTINFQAPGTLTAPYIGARYWISTLLGIDVGLGFAYAGSSSTASVAPAAAVTTDNPSSTGFGLHAGVPLALAYSKHFTFEVIPEINFGYATSTIKTVTVAPAPAVPDLNNMGIRFDLGARVGCELQMGFIGVPQLSLQATIGLGFRYNSVKSSYSDGSAAISNYGPSFATSVQDAPWAIFTNNISALYYF